MTFREMKRAAVALISASLDKDCEFTTCLKHLLAQQRVQEYMSTQRFRDCHLRMDHTQKKCDHQAGWRNLLLKTFEKEPNICSNLIIRNHYYYSPLHETETFAWSYRHCRCQHVAHPKIQLFGGTSNNSTVWTTETSTVNSTSSWCE